MIIDAPQQLIEADPGLPCHSLSSLQHYLRLVCTEDAKLWSSLTSTVCRASLLPSVGGSSSLISRTIGSCF